MNAVMLAGGIPQAGDALSAESQGRSKALVDVAGKPMAQWALDAVSGSSEISALVVIGVEASAGLSCTKPVSFLPDAGGLLENILQGLEHVRQNAPGESHVLLGSTDIPTITTEIVDWRIDAARAESADLDYAVVERSTMEARFPHANRSYLRLRDVEVCGGDLNVINVNLAGQSSLWDRLIAARKSVRRQASLLGLDLLLQVLTRSISLPRAQAKISRRLGVKGHAVISPYAELAMDVDKPEQLAIVRRDLAGRAGQR